MFWMMTMGGEGGGFDEVVTVGGFVSRSWRTKRTTIGSESASQDGFEGRGSDGFDEEVAKLGSSSRDATQPVVPSS